MDGRPEDADVDGVSRHAGTQFGHSGIALALALMGLIAVADRASAETPPTTTAPSRIKPGVLHVDRLDAYVGFDAEFERRRVRSSAPRKRDVTHENTDLTFRELIGLELSGDVIDPALLDWKADLEFGLDQDRFEEKIGGDRDVEGDTGFLQNYDLSIDAFKDKPVSLHAFARRGDNRISRRFLPSLREEKTEAGVSALAITGPVTTEVGFAWSDVDRLGNRLDLDDESLETSRFYLDSKWEISNGHSLRIYFDHERQQSTYQGSGFDFDTNRNELRVDHELNFGPGQKHRLDTYLRYNEERGDLARDELELVPRLSLQHTDKLRTVYRYGFYRYEQDAIEVNQHKFDFEALYEATKHLRLSLDAYGLYERVDGDVDSHEFGGSVDVAYDRTTSLGEFAANATFGYDHAETLGDAGRRLVLDEVHTFEGVRPVYLSKRGVVPGTIIAHDAKRTRIYTPGLDYLIRTASDRTILDRVPTGRIAEGDVVYFDYAYILPAGRTLDAYRTALSLEHTFKSGLTPYYYLDTRCEDVDESVGAPWGRDNMHRHRLGARFNREWWRIGAEFEIFDDSIEPYDAYHLTGGVDILRSAAHSLDFRGELSRYLFEGGFDDRRVWWLDVELSDRMQINDWLSLISSVAYRWEDDSEDGTTHGVDVECGLSFRRGYLSVELTVEYDLLSIAANEDDGLGLFLKVRRDIPGVLSALRKTP